MCQDLSCARGCWARAGPEVTLAPQGFHMRKATPMKITVVSLSDADLKTLGLPTAEVFSLLDDNDRNVILAARFKRFRRWWREQHCRESKPMLVV
jgi:hypothetical protein